MSAPLLEADIALSTPIVRSPRVMQVEGIFDLLSSEQAASSWHVALALPDEWSVGLIVGPSGSGKTTIARHLWPAAYSEPGALSWPADRSILDAFPATMGVSEVVELLSSVGFSSPPSWLRPYGALSNGEQFRVALARALAERRELCIVDEFTSVVDRTVAQVASAAVSKTVRRRGGQFIALSCHYDVAAWLAPDWIYQPHSGVLDLPRGRLQRPAIELTLRRCHHRAWSLFAAHHYLSADINVAARCYVAFWNDVPVAFTSILHLPNATQKNLKREHRTVTLPDYQGVGIGNAVAHTMGAMCRGLGFRYLSQTSHPAMVRSRSRSADWLVRQAPTIDRPKAGVSSTMRKWSAATRTRLVASFEYVGPPMAREAAAALWGEEVTVKVAPRRVARRA